MRIGPLRKRITLQRDGGATQDAAGQPVAAWQTVATVWAEVVPAAGLERFVPGAAQETAVLTHRVRIRYRTGVTPGMRALWGSRVLDIERVDDPTGRRAELALLCRELVEEQAGTPGEGDYNGLLLALAYS